MVIKRSEQCGRKQDAKVARSRSRNTRNETRQLSHPYIGVFEAYPFPLHLLSPSPSVSYTMRRSLHCVCPTALLSFPPPKRERRERSVEVSVCVCVCISCPQRTPSFPRLTEDGQCAQPHWAALIILYVGEGWCGCWCTLQLEKKGAERAFLPILIGLSSLSLSSSPPTYAIHYDQGEKEEACPFRNILWKCMHCG